MYVVILLDFMINIYINFYFHKILVNNVNINIRGTVLWNMKICQRNLWAYQTGRWHLKWCIFDTKKQNKK